jgi:putative acetyltransferase
MQTDIQISRIRSASREIVRQVGLLRNRFLSIGSVSLCHALVELDTHGEMNIGKLSLVLNLDQSTTSRLVVQMMRDGMCRMRPDENDRRNKFISLTQKGTKLVHTIHTEAKIQIQDALDMMDEEDKKIVVQGLSIYAKALRYSSLLKEYKIRKLLAKDVPQLINLTKSVWAEFGFDSNHPDAPVFEAELNETYEIYSAKRSSYFVLVQSKKIMGGVGFGPLAGEQKNICELKGMYLSPLIRGLGLGSILLQHTLQAAKREGFKKCYLETMDYMHEANSLYKKAGFTKLDEPRGNTKHTWTNCWYIKEL